MGIFSESMRAVAEEMINSLGNDCTLSKVITTGGTYNPSTDEYDGVDESITFNTSCSYSNLSYGDNTIKEFPEVKRVATIAYNGIIDGIDATWSFNNNKIYKVSQSIAQNEVIAYKLYIG